MEKIDSEVINPEIISRSQVSHEHDAKYTEELNICTDESSHSESSDIEECFSNHSGDDDKLNSHNNDFTIRINNKSNRNDTCNKSTRRDPNLAPGRDVSSGAEDILKPEEPAVTLEPPDGGWGWAVVIGGSLVLALTALLGPCFGVLFSRPLLEMGASSTTVAWIFNIRMLIRQSTGLFIGPLSKEFGWRIIGVTGGFLVGLSVFLCAFGKVPEYFYFSYAVVGGVGGGLAMSMPFIIVPHYFKKHLGKANSVMILGISVGQILGPTCVRYLQDEFSFKGATIILAAVFLHCVPGAMLFHPVEWYMKPVRRQTALLSPLMPVTKNETNNERAKIDHTAQYLKRRRSRLLSECSIDVTVGMTVASQSILDLQRESIISEHSSDIYEIPAPKEEKDPTVCDKICTIFKDSLYSLKILSSMRALIICFGSACVFNGFFNFFVFIPFALQREGYDLQSAAYCISTSAFCNMCTRFVLIFIADKPWFNTRLCYMIGCSIMILMTTVFPLMPSLRWMVAVMGVWGIGLSLTITFNSVLMVQYMGLDSLAPCYGASNFITGIGFIVIGPFIGMIRDVTDSYVIAIHVLSGVLAVCLLLWVFMPQAQRYDANRTSATQSNNKP